ncbi:hypothetical protein M405DRAFT_884459 [Rhizopogon salebrosus TDB-379]|nr:hypothetical protein M405DRAFT_884459 [Rhizopogon salebrosus TDB-379]
MSRLSLWRAVTLFVLFAAVFESSLVSILAVDYGSDWIKASLMKPGVPFDTCSDQAQASRFPQDSFSLLKCIQGAPYNSDIVTYFTSISTAQISETDCKTVALKQSDGTEWSTEELVAMQLSYVKKLAEDLADESVNEVVLTPAVPPYFSQFERGSVADAIEIAGLKTLALVNDGTTVAVNYAMTRTFSTTPEYHDLKTKSPYTQINVLGVGYDRNTGGTELDLRLRDILIHDFVPKHQRDIRKDNRDMAKLWKEAGRVKTIFSANSDAMSTASCMIGGLNCGAHGHQVESVTFDIDFKAKVTRAVRGCFIGKYYICYFDWRQFTHAYGSSRCESSRWRVMLEIRDSIDGWGYDLDTWVNYRRDHITLNVNADESAVLGAALYGASLCQFKTKDTRVTDVLMHDIQALYLASKSPTRTIHTAVLPGGSKYGARKTLTFKRHDDLSVVQNYPDAVLSGFAHDILEAKIIGMPDITGSVLVASQPPGLGSAEFAVGRSPRSGCVTNNLADVLCTGFKRRGNDKDLDEANTLVRAGNAKDLDTATTCHREALDFVASYSDQSTLLCNLAKGLFTRFEQKLIKREVARNWYSSCATCTVHRFGTHWLAAVFTDWESAAWRLEFDHLERLALACRGLGETNAVP